MAKTSDPDGLYRIALASTDRSAGFYNHNVRIETPAGSVVVRIPIPGADTMDLTIWPEADVVRAIDPVIARVPRLVHSSVEPVYQVVEWIDGDVLDAVAPRGKPVPGHVVGDVGELFAQLGRVPLEQLPALPADWPLDGDTASFANRLSDITASVHARFLGEFGELFDGLGFPADPLGPVLERWQTLSPRPFRLLHTDIHRKNMIVDVDVTYFLDWELALWGDPVYDLAVHLHKMGYQADEEEAAQAAWLAAVPAGAAVEWRADLATYLAHERVKSAVVDSVRYAKLIAAGTEPPDAEAALVDKLTAKVRTAHAVWKSSRAPDHATVEGCVRSR
ncbi:phosphotransferase family protein [Pseudofrankia inefficax]|uniref:phosphotransferase family protein n=1 Tax=Pseudofrankia inefficax (strain DSM 45817 / CECT 9037 / DDB 130130 / EuI1c) TaxID=298654 RepID=UPI00030F35E8|nr:aminoglycoside phosphotransferase family protein [Pseudofrankia inefficax]